MDHSPLDRPGFAARIFAVSAILIYAAVLLWFTVTAPAEVPTHFDATGRADDWDSKASLVAIFVPLGLGIPILFSIRAIWVRVPRALINAPHKNYWFDHDKTTYFYDCLMEFMRINAGALALLFAVILSSISATAASSTPGDTGVQVPIIVAPIGFLIAAAASVWLLYRRLEPRR